MAEKARKYIQIRHWDYWWSVHQCGKPGPNAVEFSLTEDEAGENLFFHFDFYNLMALEQTLREKDFIQPDDPDYPAFCSGAEALRRGELPYFIGGLHYRQFFQDLTFCNQALGAEHSLWDLKSPPAAPYYGVLFAAEPCPLTPDILIKWMERLSKPLFGEAFSFSVAHIPSKEETLESWNSEQTLYVRH